MGWWDSTEPEGRDDPWQDWDAKVRESQGKEAPAEDVGAKHEQKHEQDPRWTDPVFEQPGAATGDPAPDAVPKQSLFPDGRYAHLWKTYRPPSEEKRSDAEMNQDLYRVFQGRREEVSRAALESCADEEHAWRMCVISPTWQELFTNCVAVMRKFQTCHETQTKILKALGYMDHPDRSPEVLEKMQAHADKLYHQLRDQEAAVKKARALGLPEPEFEPLIPKPEAEAVANMSEKGRRWYEKTLSNARPEEREALEAALLAEQRFYRQTRVQYNHMRMKMQEERHARERRGEGTLKDKIDGMLENARKK